MGGSGQGAHRQGPRPYANEDLGLDLANTVYREERLRPMWRFLKACRYHDAAGRVERAWNRPKWREAVRWDGAYLSRAHWPEGRHDAASLWQTYVQLTEAEAALRVCKSEIGIRPIWHRKEKHVEAHIMVALLGYAMRVCLRKLAAGRAPSLTSPQVLQHLRKIVMVDVEFDTPDARTITLPRITVPEREQAVFLDQLGWTLPEQPPPRIRAQQLPPPGQG